MCADTARDRMSPRAFPVHPSDFSAHRLRTQPSRVPLAGLSHPLAALAFWLAVALWLLPPRPAGALINVGAVDTPGNARDVEVVGGLAYVADFSSGLRVIDVSNPAAPVELGAIDTPGFAYDVEVAGGLACVADGQSGLRVINVSSPSAPVELGAVDTPGNAYRVAVVGGLAYVADGPSGLRVIDVSNPVLRARAYQPRLPSLISGALKDRH